MAKPIFIIGLGVGEPRITHKEVHESLKGNFKDYHILVYSHGEDEIKFQCFYEKDMDEVKFEELKSTVNKLVGNVVYMVQCNKTNMVYACFKDEQKANDYALGGATLEVIQIDVF